MLFEFPEAAIFLWRRQADVRRAMYGSSAILIAIDVVVVVLLLLIFLVATVANTLILAVLYRRPSLRNTSNR